MLGSAVDGNASDRLLTRMGNHLAKHGIGDGAFVYTADSAMVTEYNLEALGANLFITRLPFNYKEAVSCKPLNGLSGCKKLVSGKGSRKKKRQIRNYEIRHKTSDEFEFHGKEGIL